METMQIPIIIAIISFSIAGFMVNIISLKQESLVKLIPIFSYGALLASAILIAVRGMLTKTLPLTNGAEFAMWIVFMVALMYVVIAKKFELFNLGLILFPIIAVLGIWLEGRSTNISALAPALNSSWLKFHVFTAIVAYGAFAISFAVALMYLIRGNSSALKVRFSDDKKLDDLINKLATTFDVKKREKITKEASQIIIDEGYGTYIVSQANVNVSNNKVENMHNFPIDYYFLTVDTKINK